MKDETIAFFKTHFAGTPEKPTAEKIADLYEDGTTWGVDVRPGLFPEAIATDLAGDEDDECVLPLLDLLEAIGTRGAVRVLVHGEVRDVQCWTFADHSVIFEPVERAWDVLHRYAQTNTGTIARPKIAYDLDLPLADAQIAAISLALEEVLGPNDQINEDDYDGPGYESMALGWFEAGFREAAEVLAFYRQGITDPKLAARVQRDRPKA